MKAQTNGHDKDERVEQVRDELGLQAEILSSSSQNPLLENTNLGLGKYTEDYKWQQIRSYRKGLFAWIAFGNALSKRQTYETKLKLGEEGYHATYDEGSHEVRTWAPWDKLDESRFSDETSSSWNSKLERGREIWQRLGEPHSVLTREQVAAVQQKTGITDDWLPMFWELVSGRHEVSRSEDAELLRDALTGIKEIRQDADEEESLL